MVRPWTRSWIVFLHVENSWLHGKKIPKGPADNCLDWNDVLPVLSLSMADIGGRGGLWFFEQGSYGASMGKACCASNGDEGIHAGPDLTKLRNVTWASCGS